MSTEGWIFLLGADHCTSGGRVAVGLTPVHKLHSLDKHGPFTFLILQLMKASSDNYATLAPLSKVLESDVQNSSASFRENGECKTNLIC
jgi:hypothetical protein